MFDFIKRLYGQGFIRCECTDTDGRVFLMKIPYIGDYNTIDKVELREHAASQYQSQTGRVLKSFAIVGAVSTK
jgi:hypothetical protein